MLQQVYPEELKPMAKAHTGAGKKCEEEGTTEGTTTDWP